MAANVCAKTVRACEESAMASDSHSSHVHETGLYQVTAKKRLDCWPGCV